jgi:hypothetical protein
VDASSLYDAQAPPAYTVTWNEMMGTSQSERSARTLPAEPATASKPKNMAWIPGGSFLIKFPNNPSKSS